MPKHKNAGRLMAGWALALAGALAHAQTPSNPSHYTRTTSFTYNADGTPATETQEPDNAANCNVKQFQYDAAGNVTQTTVANCSSPTGRAVFASRAASSTFAGTASQSITVNGAAKTVAVPAEVFPDTATDALSHAVSMQTDPRFGAVLQLTDPNGIVTKTAVDDFGRVVRRTHADKTSDVTLYCVFGSGLDTSANSSGCASSAPAEAPGPAVSYVQVEAHDASDAKMGPSTRHYSDSLGREIRVAVESFDGSSQPTAYSAAMIVSDTVYDDNGAKAMTTQPYFVTTGSSTTQGSNDVSVTLTQYDRLGRASSVYVSDADGANSATFGSNSSSVSFGNYGTRTSAYTGYAYVGQQVTTTNDLGQAHVELHDAAGEVTLVTDATGAQLGYRFGAFGELVQTRDALGNVTTVTYDLRGHKVTLKDPDQGVIAYCYDAIGQLKSEQTSQMRGSNSPAACPEINDVATNAAGTVATAVANWSMTAYDRLGRATQRIEPELSTTWSYDAYADGSACSKGIGRLCEAATTSGLDKRYAFDGYGREIVSRETISGGPGFATSVSFDATTGLLATKTFPTGVRIAYGYTSRGFLQTLSLKTAVTVNPLPDAQGNVAASKTLAVDTALWQLDTVDAWGKPELEERADGVRDATTYEPTGRVASRIDGSTSSTAYVMRQRYTWDGVGNLKTRVDNDGLDASGHLAGVSEVFGFDTLNRLSTYGVSAPAIPGLTRNVSLTYNALGMLLYKSDVGNYAYAASGASSVRPHAVQSITGLGTVSYGQDLDGNVTSASGGRYASLAYSSFEKVTSSGGGGALYTWIYDENHDRVREVRTRASGMRTLWYLNPDNTGGLGFEVETDTSPAVQNNRHYLAVGGRTVGVLITTGALPVLGTGMSGPALLASTTASKLEYWHQDHLGSLAATTDHLGNVTERYAYDPFGKRRFPTGEYDRLQQIVLDWDPSKNFGTARGFTGHEQLDDIGLVNMNGRLFDPLVGLFVQADPNITNPLNPQNFNRYAYVLNNPLNATDPSGFDPKENNGNGAPDSTILRGTDIDQCDPRGGSGNCWLIDVSGMWHSSHPGYTGKSSSPANGPAAGELPSPSDFSETGGRDPMGPASAFHDLAVAIGNTAIDAAGATNPLTPLAGNPLESLKGKCDNPTFCTIIGIELGLLGGGAAAGERALVSTAERAVAKDGARLASRLEKENCFSAGTLILTARGLVPIESVHVGDVAAARDADTQQTEWKNVIRTFNSGKQVGVKVTYRSQRGEEEIVRATVEHPFMVRGRGWVATNELHVGDQIVSLDGDDLVVTALAVDPEPVETYNFEVSGLHSYFVGRLGAWVHNQSRKAAAADLARALAEVARQKAGFAAKGQPVILDVNLSAKGMADALRAEGYNVRSVIEIFGRGDVADSKILEFAKMIDARVLTRDVGRQMDGGFFDRAINVDSRVRSAEGVGRVLEEGLKSLLK